MCAPLMLPPSQSSSRTSTLLTVAGVTVLSGFLAYAVYFDYKRRNDTDFRKKWDKEEYAETARQRDQEEKERMQENEERMKQGALFVSFV